MLQWQITGTPGVPRPTLLMLQRGAWGGATSLPLATNLGLELVSDIQWLCGLGGQERPKSSPAFTSKTLQRAPGLSNDLSHALRPFDNECRGQSSLTVHGYIVACRLLSTLAIVNRSFRKRASEISRSTMMRKCTDGVRHARWVLFARSVQQTKMHCNCFLHVLLWQVRFGCWEIPNLAPSP